MSTFKKHKVVMLPTMEKQMLYGGQVKNYMINRHKTLQGEN
jgi:hypothetical protein